MKGPPRARCGAVHGTYPVALVLAGIRAAICLHSGGAWRNWSHHRIDDADKKPPSEQGWLAVARLVRGPSPTQSSREASSGRPNSACLTRVWEYSFRHGRISARHLHRLALPRSRLGISLTCAWAESHGARWRALSSTYVERRANGPRADKPFTARSTAPANEPHSPCSTRLSTFSPPISSSATSAQPLRRRPTSSISDAARGAAGSRMVRLPVVGSSSVTGIDRHPLGPWTKRGGRTASWASTAEPAREISRESRRPRSGGRDCCGIRPERIARGRAATTGGPAAIGRRARARRSS